MDRTRALLGAVHGQQASGSVHFEGRIPLQFPFEDLFHPLPTDVNDVIGCRGRSACFPNRGGNLPPVVSSVGHELHQDVPHWSAKLCALAVAVNEILIQALGRKVAEKRIPSVV